MFTESFTVTAAAPIAIILQTGASQVLVGEDDSVSNGPTTAFLIYKPITSSTPRQIKQGDTYIFNVSTPTPIGTILGYVKLEVGASSTTFLSG